MTAKAPMISFNCDGCARPFAVPASFAGRKATCKTCGAKVVVPAFVAAATVPSAAEAQAESEATAAAPIGNSNGKPHPAPMQSRMVPAAQAPVIADAISGSDPMRAPARRSHHVAIISEAQSPPTAAAVASIQSANLPAAETSGSHTAARSDELAEPPDRQASPAEGSSPAVPKVPVRVRRLRVDAEQMAKAFSGNGPIRVKSATGDPAELYQIEYHVKGLQKGWLGRPKSRDAHLVEIQLTSEYPRLSPKCRMLTPVFHPNIDETTICVSDNWTAGERLVDLVVRIGEMLAYQAYNIKSPLNGEAAMWADLHPKKLPVDSRNLHPGEIE